MEVAYARRERAGLKAQVQPTPRRRAGGGATLRIPDRWLWAARVFPAALGLAGGRPAVGQPAGEP